MLHAHLAATRSTCDRGPELLFDHKRRGVGAVLVRENRIVAGGYNGSPPGEPHCDEFVCNVCGTAWDAEPVPDRTLIEDCRRSRLWENSRGPCRGKKVGGHLMIDGHCVRTLHAEENALLQCAIDGISPRGATVYTTASPCWDCSKRLVRVGVVRVCYGVEYGSRYGLSEDAFGLLERAGIAVELVDVSKVIRGPTFSF